MKRTLRLLAILAAAATFSAACAVESSSNILAPTSLASTIPSATPATSPSTSPYAGIWVSDAVTIPSPGSCGNFQWQVTNATASSLAGNFYATCAGNIAIKGSASGQLVGTTVPLTVSGTATYAGVISCDFSLTGTGVIENNESITIPYSGTTCFGPVQGTQRLHKPTAAAPPQEAPAPTPAPPAAPGDPLFGCGSIGDHLQLVECIWDHIHPTDAVTAFDVTKRVAWALRGEGAGLLIKNGGENIAAWRGYSFSVSRIVYPDGRLVKVIYDAGPGGANGPSWQDNGDYVDRGFYLPAIDPTLP
jgi:hypothetical protein